MSTISVRPGAVGDHPALARIFRRASLSNASDREALLAHPEALELSEDLIAGGRVRVAEFADGTVAGFAGTRWTADGVWELDDLFVDPAAMRRGVARELIRCLTVEAASEHVTRIEVAANPHAMGFYRAAGFVPDNSVATEFGPGRRMDLDVPVARLVNEAGSPRSS
jgi:GNAT superfamily N-acetyltransferase